MIVGLEDITSGDMIIGGERVNQKAPRDRNLSMVFQNYALYPHLSVYENIAFPLRLKHIPDDQVKVAGPTGGRDARADRAPAAQAGQLSGGQRQRVAMGRAIVRQANAFLFDEPLSNLDAKLRGQMRTEILAAAAQARDHDGVRDPRPDRGDDPRRPGGRAAQGRPAAGRLPAGAVRAPVNLFVAGFIGSPPMNFLPATLTNGTVKLPMVEVTLPEATRQRLGRQPDGRSLIVGIRPEDFEDATRVNGDGSARGATFRCRLDLVEAMGAEYYAHFGVGATQVRSAELAELRDDAGGVEETTDTGGIVAVARLSPQSRVRSGDEAELWLDATKMHFFDAESGASLAHGG